MPTGIYRRVSLRKKKKEIWQQNNAAASFLFFFKVSQKLWQKAGLLFFLSESKSFQLAAQEKNQTAKNIIVQVVKISIL